VASIISEVTSQDWFTRKSTITTSENTCSRYVNSRNKYI